MTQGSASLEKKWTFTPDVPTYDFFEHRDIRDVGELEWLVGDLTDSLERGEFLRWEAVVCQELGLPLTERQRQVLSDLINFNDETNEDRILYINGLARPSQLWYEIVRKIAPHLFVTEFRTFDVHYTVTTDGWSELVAALEQYGQDLSLPESVERPVEVVPAGLRHRLWIQTCFGALGGLGQEAELTLKDEEEHYRIEEFLACMREHKESVEYLGLTLEKLLRTLILPPPDEPIFIEMMSRQLRFASTTDPIAGRL